METRGDTYKFDSNKLMWDLLPIKATEAIVDVLTYGANKYKPGGWRTVPDGRRRYIAAFFRHFISHLKGERIDPESGKPHIAHALCNLVFIYEFDEGDK